MAPYLQLLHRISSRLTNCWLTNCPATWPNGVQPVPPCSLPLAASSSMAPLQTDIEDNRGPKQSFNVKIKAAALVDLKSLESFVK